MCVRSMIMDHYLERWQPLRWTEPWVIPDRPYITGVEIAEFRRLLERASEYDRQHAEPDCELDEKRRALKTLARDLGVEIDFLDSPGATSASVSPDPALPTTQVAPEG